MTKPKYRRLTYEDKRVIENISKAKNTQSDIARAIVVSRELLRNCDNNIYRHDKAFVQSYLRLLMKPRLYAIAEAEAGILETYLKKKWSPETISTYVLLSGVAIRLFRSISNGTDS